MNSLEKRFWDKVALPDHIGTSECWLWTAGKMSAGYGAFKVRGKQCNAHRVAYEFCVGPIPAGLFALHDCPNGDNPLCVNPAHLWVGAHDDNMKDKAAKGRAPSGEAHKNSVLTEEQVREIRARYYAGGVSQRQLAREYGVDQGTIGAIVLFETWKNLQ